MNKENALNNYEGTVLYVSHDRYFINKTASRILDLTSNKLFNYIGNYDYYLEKRDAVMAAANALSEQTAATNNTGAVLNTSTAPSNTANTQNKLDWKAQKEEQARMRKLENDLKKCEERIEKLENRNAVIDEEMAKPEIATNSVKLQELAKEQTANNEELEKLFELWEELAEAINE